MQAYKDLIDGQGRISGPISHKADNERDSYFLPRNFSAFNENVAQCGTGKDLEAIYMIRILQINIHRMQPLTWS